MELLAGLDLHVRDIAAHDPLPVAEHLDHCPGDLSVLGNDLLPGGRQAGAALLAKQVKQCMGNQESPHVRVRLGVLKGVLNISQIRVAHIHRVGGPLRVGAEVSIESVDGGVLDSNDLDLIAEDVQADVVAHGDVPAVGRAEAEDARAAAVGEGCAVEPADEEGEELGVFVGQEHDVLALVFFAVEEGIEDLGLGAEELGVDSPFLLLGADRHGHDAVGEPAGGVLVYSFVLIEVQDR